jgi:hypothetical protein
VFLLLLLRLLLLLLLALLLAQLCHCFAWHHHLAVTCSAQKSQMEWLLCCAPSSCQLDLTALLLPLLQLACCRSPLLQRRQ